MGLLKLLYGVKIWGMKNNGNNLAVLLFANLIPCMSLFSPIFFSLVLLQKKEGREIGLIIFVF
jgi:hypothetical protein